MKKVILSLVAALSVTVASAQSNVTIYGVADVGAAYSSSQRTDNVDTKSGVYSNLWEQSLIGFKGSEALGNGMKAVFQLEYAIDVSQNDAFNNAREQSLGLDTQLGLFKLGRLESADSIYQKRFDAMEKTAFSPLTTIGVIAGQEAFLNSTAAYQGKFSDFTFGGSYSFDGTGANGISSTQAYGNGVDQEQVYSLNAGYGAGPFGIGYVYTGIENFGRTDNGADIHFVGASYDFGIAKLVGSYRNAQDDAKLLDNEMYNVGAQIPLSAATRIDVAYGYIDNNLSGAGNANVYGVQLSHNLSKRTMVYTGYQYVDNNGTEYAALGTTFGVPTQGGGSDSSYGIGAGMKHSF